MGPSIPASSRGFESYLLEEQARLAKLPEISVRAIPNTLKLYAKRSSVFVAVQIDFRGLTHHINIKNNPQRIPNLFSTAYDTLKWIIPLTWVFALKKSRGEEQHPFYTLYDCDGHLTPGTMTLVMAPPGT